MCKSNPHFKVFAGVKLLDLSDMYPLLEELIQKSNELLCLYPFNSAKKPLTRLDERAWVEFYFDDLFWRLTNRLRKLLPIAVHPSTEKELDDIIYQHQINKPSVLMVVCTCYDLKHLIEKIYNLAGLNPDGSRLHPLNLP